MKVIYYSICYLICFIRPVWKIKPVYWWETRQITHLIFTWEVFVFVSFQICENSSSPPSRTIIQDATGAGHETVPIWQQVHRTSVVMVTHAVKVVEQMWLKETTTPGCKRRLSVVSQQEKVLFSWSIHPPQPPPNSDFVGFCMTSPEFFLCSRHNYQRSPNKKM